MADLELKNQSRRQFTDISSESIRHYILANGQQLSIQYPQYLSVSESGNHYIVALDGVVYCIAPGWLALSWTPKEGEPHIVA